MNQTYDFNGCECIDYGLVGCDAVESFSLLPDVSEEHTASILSLPEYGDMLLKKLKTT
jgi:hypothetical protein